MKLSEARILAYLKNVSNPLKFARMISTKLGMDYCYMNGILAGMVLKGWLLKHRLENKVFYDLRDGNHDRIEQAKQIMLEDKRGGKGEDKNKKKVRSVRVQKQ